MNKYIPLFGNFCLVISHSIVFYLLIFSGELSVSTILALIAWTLMVMGKDIKVYPKKIKAQVKIGKEIKR